ncbi:aldolase/citrate lyase family protein, partial [Harryflintia acetispora]|uniref:aldolase/citrate lyase family protein n=1 Tax=Harryflintia acetispora TaxID=1849041 RepID=UPI00256FCAA0
MFQIDELKKKLENGGLAIGTHVKWREASFSELFAMEGYDYIWIDGEHSALTLDMVAAQVRAAQANGAAAFYRVPWNDPVLVKPVLEIGVDGVIFPFIRTAKEAAAAVAACKYPPEGIRGYAPGRAIRYGLTPM